MKISRYKLMSTHKNMHESAFCEKMQQSARKRKRLLYKNIVCAETIFPAEMQTPIHSVLDDKLFQHRP